MVHFGLKIKSQVSTSAGAESASDNKHDGEMNYMRKCQITGILIVNTTRAKHTHCTI